MKKKKFSKACVYIMLYMYALHVWISMREKEERENKITHMFVCGGFCFLSFSSAIQFHKLKIHILKKYL